VWLFFAAVGARLLGEGGQSVMLVELGLVEQRHKGVLEVLDGVKIADVAVLCGVSRKTVHKWLRRDAAEGVEGAC